MSRATCNAPPTAQQRRRAACTGDRSLQIQAAVFTTRLVLSDTETALRAIRGKRSLAMLAAAAAGGYEQVVTELLRINADVDAKDKYASARRGGPAPCHARPWRVSVALRALHVARRASRVVRSCALMCAHGTGPDGAFALRCAGMGTRR